MQLILASTSPYRAALLGRLGVGFDVQAPGVDETRREGESALSLAKRLAEAKCEALVDPERVVIGADQVADLNGRILGKPGNHANALDQLMACQGHTVLFHTAVCVAGRGHRLRHVDQTRVVFRTLPEAALDRYLTLEKPYDCAGGFKAEALGIRLFQTIESEDPTALIGLPLIWLADAMAQCGFDALADPV